MPEATSPIPNMSPELRESLRQIAQDCGCTIRPHDARYNKIGELGLEGHYREIIDLLPASARPTTIDVDGNGVISRGEARSAIAAVALMLNEANLLDNNPANDRLGALTVQNFDTKFQESTQAVTRQSVPRGRGN